MAAGELTAEAARKLTQNIANPRFEVLFDHGDTNIDPVNRVGQIASWFGGHYDSNSRLSLLDIAVVDRHLDRAIVLVEVEESSSSPKTIIGDAFGILFGDHITFQGKRNLVVGDFTRFLVLLNGRGERKRRRALYLQNHIAGLIKHMQSGNSSIQDLSIDIFQNENALYDKLNEFIGESLAMYIEKCK